MTPEELTKFKETAEKLRSLETTLSLLQGNRVCLEISGESEKPYVKVEVGQRGTNASIWLSAEMMKAVHLALSLVTSEEISRVEKEIAFL